MSQPGERTTATIRAKRDADAMVGRWDKLRASQEKEKKLLDKILEMVKEVNKATQAHATAKKEVKAELLKVMGFVERLEMVRERTADLTDEFGPNLNKMKEEVEKLAALATMKPIQATAVSKRKDISPPEASTSSQKKKKAVKLPRLELPRLELAKLQVATPKSQASTPFTPRSEDFESAASEGEWTEATSRRKKNQKKREERRDDPKSRGAKTATLGRSEGVQIPRGKERPRKKKKKRTQGNQQERGQPERERPKKEEERRPRVKPDAVLIKTKQDGPSYADMLRKVKQGADAQEVGSKVSKIRKTNDGHILIELQKGTDAEAVKAAIEGIVKDDGDIRRLSTNTTLEVHDIDDVTTAEDVKNAIVKMIGDKHKDSVLVRTLRQSFRGTQIAVVTVPARLANSITSKRTIRIGWTDARVREKGGIPRCYNCLQYGHIATKCKEPKNPSKRCYRCGDESHLAARCQEPPKCLSCEALEVDSNHRSGDLDCQAYQRARAEIGRRSRKRNG